MPSWTDDLRADDLARPPEPLNLALARMAGESLLPRPEQTASDTQEAERSLHSFVRLGWPVLEPARAFVDGWHIGCLCEHLQALTELEISQLIVNEPPGYMKSLTAGVFWFAWVWLRQPSSRWIYSSYGANLVRRDAGKSKDLIRSNWYQSRWGNVFHIRHARDTLERFENDRTGYRISTTVLGQALGERADYACWDDPHKATEVGSEAMRKAVIDAYGNTVTTRAGDPHRFRKLVIMQRLHERDLSGHLLAERTGWQHLCLPAEYEPARYFLPQWLEAPAGLEWMRRPQPPRDPITPTLVQLRRPELIDGPSGSGRREEGDLLWPRVYDRNAVEALRAGLEAVGSAGQLQQRPNPPGGTVFRGEHFRHFLVAGDGARRFVQLGPAPDDPHAPPPLRIDLNQLRFYQTADTALKVTESAKFTVVMTFAWHRPSRNLLVWHLWRGKLNVHEQLEALRQCRDGAGHFDFEARRWAVPGVLRPWPSPVLIQGVENKASGIGLLTEAAAAGYPLTELRAVLDKVQRCAGVVSMLAQGRVWFRAGAPWLVDFEDELLTFPRGAYSDRADCLGYGGILASEDGLLNAEMDGMPFGWPAPPTDAAGEELPPERYADPDRVETVRVREGVDVEFDDWESDGGLHTWR